MAKSGMLPLALLGALLFLQLALAVKEKAPVAIADETSIESVNANEVAGEEAELAVPDVTDDKNTIGSARMLWEHNRHSKTCRSASKCHRWFKWAGCCNHWCVNLSSNNKHCGKCGKCCPKNTICKNGKCKKVHKPPVHKPPVHAHQCGPKKSCAKKGQKCCDGRCSDLEDDSHNCGRCGKKCGGDSFCCKGKCKTSSNQHCGKWGKKCHFGSVCCEGECKFVHKNDRDNCGACGKECPKGVRCRLGMCGYGQ